ncbi:CHAT domain-containing protein [Tenacibaculum halocynthiae]|uniref:CHAT domain-containing protein n=1 Tax=Tenacibaculum halocynthiae TaxID=1254437 RepID=UPI003D6530A6
MKRTFVKLFFFGILLLFYSNLNAQNLREYYGNLNVLNANLNKIEYKVDSILNSAIKTNNFNDAIYISHHFSLKRYKLGEINTAIKYGKKEIIYYEQQKILNSNYANACYNLGRFYYKKSDYQNAIQIFTKVINVNSNSQKTAFSHGELGRIYDRLGQFYSAIDNYKKSINLLEKKGPSRFLFFNYVNLAKVYDIMATKKSYKKALKYFTKAQNIVETKGLKYKNLLSFYNGFASYYSNNETFDFKKAKKYHKKGIVLATIYQDSISLSTIHLNLGYIYLKQEELANHNVKDSLFYHLEKSKSFTPSFDNDKTIKSRYYSILSDFETYKKNYNQALIYRQKALETNIPSINKVDVVPSLLDLKNSNDQHFLIGTISNKANILDKMFKENGNPEHLKLAISHLKVADSLISYIQEEGNEERSKLFWRGEASYVYAKAVGISHLMNKPDLAFYFTEKNKGIILTEGIRDNTENKLPKQIKERQRLLKKQMLFYENAVKKADTESLQKVKQNLFFDSKQKYQVFTDSIKNVFPEYTLSKVSSSIISITNLQETLDENTSLISYILNKDDTKNPTLHGLIISKSIVKIFNIKKPKNVINLISEYRAIISKPFETINESNYFNEVSNKLYLALFPNKENIPSLLKKKLIIIPDGELQYIPFEALIIDQKSKQYFIQKHQINYAYSASFLTYNNNIKRKYTTNFSGFAPVSFKHNNLSKLKKSANEIETIYAQVGGQQFLREEASKANFLTKASNSEIIHLATHADASKNPWIGFYDNKLEAHELYASNISSELVVLSGCDTSLGEIIPGEGVMSLSRGFFHAGANTVASTLWNANDKSTAIIMAEFYKNLKRGLPKATALHKAKLNYIETANLSEKAPYYWAPMILVGDGENIIYTSLSFKFLYGIGLLVLLLMFFFFWKYTRIRH